MAETDKPSEPFLGSTYAAHANKAYAQADPFNDLSECDAWLVFARGNIGFRYGPFKPTEVGPLLQRCNDEDIPATIVFQPGTDVDWELVKQWARGVPQNYRTMDEAPRDGTTIIVDTGHVEQAAVWWQSWEWWRVIGEDGQPGKPCDPLRWRPAEEGDLP